LSAITSEIEQFMTGPVKEGTSLTARFLFPSGFIGFQGHFPQKKILPGICQIQCALAVIEKGTGKKIALREIVLAKYHSPLFPGDELTCAVNDPGEADEITVKALITKGTVKISELKLRVAATGSGASC
jgi:3-hydroxyacyl-[acyl-carrier-protein] dehydratase